MRRSKTITRTQRAAAPPDAPAVETPAMGMKFEILDVAQVPKPNRGTNAPRRYAELEAEINRQPLGKAVAIPTPPEQKHRYQKYATSMVSSMRKAVQDLRYRSTEEKLYFWREKPATAETGKGATA